MKQVDLLDVLYNKQVYGAKYLNKEVTSLTNDSRSVEPGACFIALVGEHFDGHQAVEEVVSQGVQLVVVEDYQPSYADLNATIVVVPSTFRAQAILANQFYHEPSRQLQVVAVTGTNGKTTTSSMISDLLTHLDHTTGQIGTLHYKVKDRYYPAVNTTPDALTLQSLFNEMVTSGCQDAVIEASSHALALGRLWYTDIDCAIFTNLTREHLDFHKTMDQYANAKSLLFSQLGQSFHQGRPRLGIINMDDSYASIMAQATGADIVTYSLEDSKATAYAFDVEDKLGGSRFKIQFKGDNYSAEIPMRGLYNISNYLAAFLCLTEYYGYSPQEVIQASQSFKGVPGRMESVQMGQDFDIIVDFAHTSDALERVMQELSKSKQGRLIALMGHSGGNRDSGARPGIGDVLFKYADYIVFTADNPRFEKVSKICREMIGDHQEKSYTVIEDRKDAVTHALEAAQAGDIVLLAGKGGEGYQVIGDDKVPYDDVEEVEAYYQSK